MTIVYTLPSCVQCGAVKKYLNDKGAEYEVVDLSQDETAAALVRDLGYLQAPVVITDDSHFSGFNPYELAKIA